MVIILYSDVLKRTFFRITVRCVSQMFSFNRHLFTPRKDTRNNVQIVPRMVEFWEAIHFTDGKIYNSETVFDVVKIQLP